MLIKRNSTDDIADYQSSPKNTQKSEEKYIKSQKFKIKVNSKYQTGYTDKMEEQVNDRRQEILMDGQPRLRIFRFKQKTSSQEEM